MDRLRFGETHSIMEKTLWIGLLGILLCSTSVDSYSKYGRTCKDIGCKSDEVCVLDEDRCTYETRGNCGQFPTCKKSRDEALSCNTLICPSGQYCKIVDGQRRCVDSTGNHGYDSAGVSYVNGHPTNTDTTQNHGTPTINYNPYSNANAPPPETSHDTNYHQVNTANNGYPQYPPSGNNPSYSSYPRPPSSGTNLGYPPYPTQNRMPQPGVYQPGYPNYSPYPSNQQPGQQYPNYQNPYNTNSRRYHGAAASNSPQIMFFCFLSIVLLGMSRYLS